MGNYKIILDNYSYQKLIRKKKKTIFLLSFVVLALYSIFIASIIFLPGFISGNHENCVFIYSGLWLELSVIASFFLVTVIYTLRANKRFDYLTNNITKK